MTKFSYPAKSLAAPALLAERLLGLIATDLAAVETELTAQARSHLQVVHYLGDYLRAAGGKRIRPALTILAHHALGGGESTHDQDHEALIRMAAVMEFLHTATLVHDDIIDNAETRRGQASLNARFGNQTSVLMGDWLYMSAFETSLTVRSWAILDILTRVTRLMTEGELLQLTLLGRTEVAETDYFAVLQRKTAYLFSACCEIGAILAGAGSIEQEALREYGLQLGTAFQLVDDILDCTVTADSLGKAAGADLLEGKLTLPLIYLLEAAPQHRAALQRIIWEGNYAAWSRDSLRAALSVSGAEVRARDRAQEAAALALAALDVLPPTPYQATLRALPEYVLARRS